MKIRVFDALADAERWRAVLQRLPPDFQDLYFGPEWSQVHCLNSGARARLFVAEQGPDLWVNAFVQNPIEAIGHTHVREEGRSDIETAYGYGGPLATTESARFLDGARQAFCQWCREEGVVAEFVRFHPILENERFVGSDERMRVLDDRKTVLIDLGIRRSGEFAYDKEVQYMLRRASRLGLELVRANPRQMFHRFEALYAAKMRDLKADEYYFFNESYFQSLAELTAEQGCLIAARDPQTDEWLAAAVFLGGERFLHYHLSANAVNRKLPGVTNWILDEAVRFGIDSGLTEFHLGGGRSASPDDSLFRFKRAMGDRLLQFKIGRCVHDATCYDRFTTMWLEQGGNEKRVTSRLLAYRSPCAWQA